MAKKTPAINSSSTADIAFLLLCFFLMTTQMGSQTGLSRRLPPKPTSQKVKNQEINRRNIIIVKINAADRILAGNKAVDVTQLKDEIKIFLQNPTNDPNLPERELKEFQINGKTVQREVSKGLISLQNDRGTSYRAYIAVQNELVKAINELRDDAAMRDYGRKFAGLTESEQDVVKKIVPMQISEAEPKDISKKK